MRRLFISDLHLDDKRPDITRAFFHLLNRFSGKTDELYILGDFFELWLGDDALTPTAKSVAEKLKQYSEHTKVFIMHGNRDFLMGDQYANACGAQLIHEPHFIELAGKPTLLMHGDSLCTEDHQYMEFRKMVRNPQWQESFLSKSIEERIAFGKQAREQSQSDTKQKSYEILDVTPSEVEKVIQSNEVTLFIHGHTHRPAHHHLEKLNAERIVLGDWHNKGWYLFSDENELTLENFDFPA